jgi:hypothetical protein
MILSIEHEVLTHLNRAATKPDSLVDLFIIPWYSVTKTIAETSEFPGWYYKSLYWRKEREKYSHGGEMVCGSEFKIEFDLLLTAIDFLGLDPQTSTVESVMRRLELREKIAFINILGIKVTQVETYSKLINRLDSLDQGKLAIRIGALLDGEITIQ